MNENADDECVENLSYFCIKYFHMIQTHLALKKNVCKNPYRGYVVHTSVIAYIFIIWSNKFPVKNCVLYVPTPVYSLCLITYDDKSGK